MNILAVGDILKTINLIRTLLITLVLLLSCILANNIYLNQKETMKNKIAQNELSKKHNETLSNQVFEECMNNPYKSPKIEEQIDILKRKYTNNGIAFVFLDIENEYSYSLNEQEQFYGASIIKLLEANYLINQALDKKISLDEKIMYEQKHQLNYSIELEKYHFGDEISLRNLIFYAISVSDNTAHEMLLEYIGIDNLKEYANTLGIQLTINESEHFGYLNALDGLKILQETYKIIKEHNKYSKLLSRAMNNDYYNSLNFKNINFLHKYGLTEEYYNEIGIYLNEEPYLISIFSTSAYDNYQEIISTLSEKIYNIYIQNIEEKNQYCTELKSAIF